MHWGGVNVADRSSWMGEEMVGGERVSGERVCGR